MVDSSVLKKKFDEVEPILCSFQRQQIYRMLEKARREVTEADTHMIRRCPKCGYALKEGEKWIGGGFTNGEGSKPMWRCIFCHKRFTKDYGQLTWQSQQSQFVWNIVIQKTVAGDSLIETAAEVDVSPNTVLHMRHKILKALEDADNAEPVHLEDQIEFDEKYVEYSHKGYKDPNLPGRKRGAPACKRGISNEKACLITGIKRLGSALIHCWNMGRPMKEDVEHLASFIQEKSVVFTDCTHVYDSLLKMKECRHIYVSENNRDSVTHINNVNSFHSAVEKQYERYRGVSTKYLNRYCALFRMQRECQGMDMDEILLHVLGRLRKFTSFFPIKDHMTRDLFTGTPSHPHQLACRCDKS